MLDLYSLLSRGYFPRELPPPFSTESFAVAVTSNIQSIPASFSSVQRISKLCRHNIAKVGIDRRTLSIPNPVGYYNLANALVQFWNDINAFVNQSTISKSVPSIIGSSGRSILPIHSQQDLTDYKVYTRAKSKYILSADISRFYPSIYTHSIPWALHTKRIAKANKNNYRYYGNVLDRWVQKSQDGQTMGVPIGPDSSLVISEIILTASDSVLSGQLNKNRCFRYVDDYEIGCTSYAEAEQMLARLQHVLSEFELEINPLKTRIIELPTTLDSPWVHELRNFLFRTVSKQQRTDLIAYFDRAFTLADQYPNDYVLKYAVQRLQSVQIDQSNWDLAEQLHLQCVMIETGTFLPVLGRLIDRHIAGFQIDIQTLGEVINSQLLIQCPVDHGSEVAWALWAAIFWNIQIANESAQVLSVITDSIVALLGLDANRRGLIPNGLDTTNWEMYMTTDELYSDQWLLSYEANKKGWLPSKTIGDHVMADTNFAYLKNNRVEFYDLNKVKAVPTGASISLGHYPLFDFETKPIGEETDKFRKSKELKQPSEE
jgi:hypothetical protein